eukprot:COSAG02_NODE_26199_length_638_cov_1.265306_1_plen_181_part_10
MPATAAAKWKSLEQDGAITLSALTAALSVHGVRAAAAKSLFAELDVDGDGEIDMDEWLAGFGRYEEVAAGAPQSTDPARATESTQRPPKDRLLHTTGASPKRPKPKVLPSLVSSAATPPRRLTEIAKSRTTEKSTGKSAKPRRVAPLRGKKGRKLKKGKKSAQTGKTEKLPEVNLSPEDLA